MEAFSSSWLELLFWLMLGAAEPDALAPLPADAYLDGLPERCEILLAADVREADSGLAAIRERWSRPELRAVPDVVEGLAALDLNIGYAESQVRGQLALSPLTDLDALSVCLNVGSGPSGLPEMHYIASLQGQAGFADDLLLTLGARLSAVEGHAALYDEANDSMVLLAAPDRLFWGWRGYVEPLLGGTSSSSPAAATVNARLQALAPHGVRWFAGFDPELAMRFLIAGFATQSVTQHVNHLDFALFAGNDDVAFVEAKLNNAAGLADYELMLTGLGRLAEAAPVLFESLASLILGSARPGDTAYSPQVIALVEHRELVFSLLREAGAFQAPSVSQVTDTDALTVSLTLTESRGLQTLARQFLLLGVLASGGSLPATVDSFALIPRWWGERL